MIVLVCGGRYYQDRHFVFGVLNQVHEGTPITKILNGGATGADTLGRMWAETKNIPRKTFYPRWDVHGKAGGSIRNQRMLDEGHPDLVVAFPGGNGTAHMISLAEAAGVRVLKAIV